MRAFVFWHRAAPGASRSAYDAAQVRFHERLAATSTPGFIDSATYRVSALPWLSGEEGYEDWYLVADSAGLDPLNEASVAGRMKQAHDEAAADMEEGYGGLYALLWGEPAAPARSRCLWLSRPRGVTYAPILEAFRERLGESAVCWRKQMVMGPGREFAVFVDPEHEIMAPEGWTVMSAERTRLWPPPAADAPKG